MFDKLFGGAPIATLLKLLIVSLIVGAVLSAIGFTPTTIVRQIGFAIEAVADLGVDAFRDAGRYLLTGAVIVVPIWLLMRLAGRGR